MITKILSYIKLLFLAVCVFMQQDVLCQGMYTTFGQNRVQHGRFEWSYLRSENYDAYFYTGGRELATFAARTAEQELNDIENIVDHRLSERVEIICYNNMSDYKQGNFNLTDEPVNTGGTSQVNSNKIFVYFTGNHAEFKKQIRTGIALVLINELLFGGNIQERVQNAALLSLPDWYLFGLAEYIGNAWDIEKDNKLKDIILNPKFKKFNRLIQQNPLLAGTSYWRFIVEKYGNEVVANMLYITRLSRNYETALVYVTGSNLKNSSTEWLQYYRDQYAKEDNGRMFPMTQLKIKKRLMPYVENGIYVSPKGDKLIYKTNKYGKFKIWMLDVKTNKSKKIHKGGIKYYQQQYDHSFPMVAWHPGGEKFTYIHEKKGKVILTTVDLITKKKQHTPLLKFDKVLSFTFSPSNQNLLILSAVRKGQSDLYTYDIQSRRERQLTNDLHDDLYPRFVDGGAKIIFSSNRNSNLLNAPIMPTLQKGNSLDIYLYDFENPGIDLKRLTYTEDINETHPIEYNSNYYSFLTEYNGIKNRYAARVETEYDFTELNIHYRNPEIPIDTLFFDELKDLGKMFEYEGKRFVLDSNITKIDTIIHNKDIVFTYPQTNYKRNILSHDVAIQTQQLYEIVFDEKKFHLFTSPVSKTVESDSRKIETYPNMFRLKNGPVNKAFVAGPVVYSKRRKKQAPVTITIEVPKAPETYPYFFVNDYTEPSLKVEDIKVQSIEKPISENIGKNFKLAAPRFYNVTFFSDFLVSQIDNSVINTYYQPITPDGQNMFNPGINAMFKVGLIDLFEDYRIVGGFRFTLDFSGADYFLSYETLKKRIDHKLIFYRQVRDGQTENTSTKSISNELRYQIKYPLSPVASFRLQAFGRRDQYIYQAVSRPTLEMPDDMTNWYGGKTEFVFDNTIPKGLNLWNGTRFKIFYEHYQSWEKKDVQLNAAGFDFRHYQRLHRQLIFATRLTYNTSFGPAKVKYVLGGLDNWLFAQYDNSQGTVATQNYAFQALATNMRGFKQNIRNGNSFASISNEFRFPIFAYILNRPIRSEFINNFQIVPFFDIGTAWVGSDPYSEDNTNNMKIVERKYIRVQVINVREPIVAGTGGGLRTKLFGYFIRFDTAWGIQDREFNDKPIYYLSLSMDF